ncbi:conserved hypothetical protein, membrane [Candidatus Magnetobacterium bavaricum]|uniref:Uncharacterized protein n=1 Tax=Candidatus Magnetobacterium bavaricum TaxID=29290 RepID=A0A0F3GXI8_9BACT|nr:conserved hypothetical protein, membrane [Candidatus Magnetobacterium bavaricum]
MKCPMCKSDVKQLSKACNSCGYAYPEDIFKRIAHVFGIKKELISAVERLNNIQDVLGRLNSRVGSLEELLNDDLVARTHMPPPELKTSLPKPPPPEKEPGPPPELYPEPPPKGQDIDQDISPPKVPPAQRLKCSIPEFKKPELDFELKFGQKWLLIIGIVTIVFGVAYFLKYSFDRGWVGPAGRVALSYLWAISFLVGGELFRRKGLEIFGLYVIGGGIAILYFSTFAAFSIYHLFGQILAFGIMILITAFATVSALRYDSKWLAVLGLIGGFLTPMLLSTGTDNQIALMTYMTVLNLALLMVALYKKWDMLNYLGFVLTYILFTAWVMMHYSVSKFWPTILFLNTFYAIYSVIPFAYQFLKSGPGRLRAFYIISPNSFIAFGFSYPMIKEYASVEWVSVISILYAAVFVAMAAQLLKQGKESEKAFIVVIAKAALFLIITIPILFSRHWITIFWCAQSVTIFWIALRFNSKALIYGAYVLFALANAKFLFYDYQYAFRLNIDSPYVTVLYTYLIAERYITSALVVGISYVFYRLSRKAMPHQAITDRTPVVFAVIGGVMLFIVLSIETSAFFQSYLPQGKFAAISVLWSAFAAVLLLKGFVHNNKAMRHVSFGLFLVTLFKVFLFDMSRFSTPYRIISFIILGLVLVAASYLYHNYKDKIIKK